MRLLLFSLIAALILIHPSTPYAETPLSEDDILNDFEQVCLVNQQDSTKAKEYLDEKGYKDKSNGVYVHYWTRLDPKPGTLFTYNIRVLKEVDQTWKYRTCELWVSSPGKTSEHYNRLLSAEKLHDKFQNKYDLERLTLLFNSKTFALTYGGWLNKKKYTVEINDEALERGSLRIKLYDENYIKNEGARKL